MKLLILQLVLLSACAHQRPLLWEVCRDACGANGAAAAAVAGPVDQSIRPICVCGSPAPKEGT
jgi:hypothetical protein